MIRFSHASESDRCSVIVSLGEKCGAPGVLVLDSDRGHYVECVDHALASDVAKLDAVESDAPVAADYRLPSGNRSSSRAGFLLVDRFDVIRGYAESDGPAVAKRAARLSARIVRNPRFA